MRSTRNTKRKSSRRSSMINKKRRCPLTAQGLTEVDYLDFNLLRTFISDDCKIIPSRTSGVTAKMQRRLAVAIKRARFLALIPYTDQHSS